MAGVDGVAHCGCGYLVHATVAAHARDHLHVVVVAYERLRAGLYVAVELLVIYIHEVGFAYGLGRSWACVALLTLALHDEPLCHPLVPLCEHEHLGMLADGLLELFGKELAVGSHAAQSVLIHRRLPAVAVALAYARAGMHGCGDGHLLIHSASGLLGIIGLLGVEGEPRPFVLPFLPCPTVPHGEVVAYLLADVGLCRGVDKDERLAVPAEPVLVVGRFLVPFIIELRHHACGVGVAAEGQLG